MGQWNALSRQRAARGGNYCGSLKRAAGVKKPSIPANDGVAQAGVHAHILANPSWRQCVQVLWLYAQLALLKNFQEMQN
jgi:hypothetical protein